MMPDEAPTRIPFITDHDTSRQRVEAIDTVTDGHPPEWFRTAFLALSEAVYAVDTTGRITFANAACEVLTGYSIEELVGRSSLDLYPAEVAGVFTARRQQAYQGQTLPALETELIRKNGQRLQVELSVTSLTSGDRLSGRLTLLRDITERKRAEAEIRQRNHDLEVLLQIISHDLREPLRAIEGFSQLLHERYLERLDDKGRDFLQRIVRGIDRMNQLLSDLLTLAQARRMQPPTTTIDLRLIIRDVLRQLEPQIRITGAQVYLARDFPHLRVNRTWASLGIANLVSNALKFTRDGEAPEVEIVPYWTAGEVGIAVRDRGPGIEAADLGRIFHLFRRAAGREVPGTGAGLAIVQQIAERHGGRAWAQPRAGGGAEFVLTFGQGARPIGSSYE